VPLSKRHEEGGRHAAALSGPAFSKTPCLNMPLQKRHSGFRPPALCPCYPHFPAGISSRPRRGRSSKPGMKCREKRWAIRRVLKERLMRDDGLQRRN